MRSVRELTWNEALKLIKEKNRVMIPEIFEEASKGVSFDIDGVYIDIEPDKDIELIVATEDIVAWSSLSINTKEARYFVFTDTEIPGKEFLCIYGELYRLVESGGHQVKFNTSFRRLYFSYPNAGVENV